VRADARQRVDDVLQSGADLEWTEAEGFPTAGAYRGHEAVVQGVFMPLGEEYE
jgi:hypothetical protein